MVLVSTIDLIGFEPLMQVIADLRWLNRRRHLSHVITLESDYFLLSAIRAASLLSNTSTDGPIPPLTEDTSGVSEPYSISLTL